MAIDKIVAEYRLELDGLRKDFDAVKDQVKSLEKTISKSADTGSKKFDEMGNQVEGSVNLEQYRSITEGGDKDAQPLLT